MKKLFFFLAAVAVAVTANAKVIQGTPNPGENGRVNWWANGAGEAEAGDTIVLADGIYEESTLTLNDEGLVIMAAEGAKPVIVLTDAGGWGSVQLMASVTFDGICFDGNTVTKYMIQVAETNVKKAVFNNCEFRNWAKHAICDPWTDKYENGKHIDSVLINNSIFYNGGTAVCFSKYGPDSKHVCDYLEIKNTTINKVDITTDPTDTYYGIIHASSNNEAEEMQNEVVIDHVTIYDYTMGSLGAITVRKSKKLKISNSIIANPAGRDFYAFYIYGGTVDNTFYFNGKDKSGPVYTDCKTDDPMFVDADNGDFTLREGSPALTAATNGGAIGDPRWAPVVEEPEEPVYEVYEVEINDLSIDLDSLILYGSASADFDVEVKLGLGESDLNTGIYQLKPESYVGINGSDATFVEGTAYEIDAFAPAAKAVVRCIWNGMNIELQLNMSAAPLEATVVVVENANVAIEKYLIFGDMYDYALKMTGVWTNEGVDYPVLVEVPVYYPEATEASTIFSTVTVGDLVDENGPWLGFGEGDLTIETVDGVVTATGVVQNPMVGIAIDITISGTVPQGPTGVENLNGTVAPAKMIKNGQLIIRNNGVEFNAQGAVVK